MTTGKTILSKVGQEKNNLSRPKETYHSSKDHGILLSNMPLTNCTITPLGKRRSKKKKKRKRKIKAPVESQPMPNNGKGDLETNARKRAASYSTFYRQDKQGVSVVKPLRSKQTWPEPSGDQKVTKETTINKLLGADNISHMEAIYKVYGVDVVEQKYVRGYLIFKMPLGNHGTKKIITPKGFWSIKMPYHKMISNYEAGFRGLRNQRVRDGALMTDIVEWCEIKQFKLYIDIPPEGKDKWDKATTRGGPVPLDSRKATDLLVLVDKQITNGGAASPFTDASLQGGGEPSQKRAPNKKKKSLSRAPTKADKGLKRSQSAAANKKAADEALKDAMNQLTEITSRKENVQFASVIVKDIFILPTVSRDITSHGNNASQGVIQQMIVSKMAEHLAFIVDAKCPDGVDRYISAQDARALVSRGENLHDTIILDSDSVNNELQRTRCQYECDIPTHDDLRVVGSINLRNPVEMRFGTGMFLGHRTPMSEALHLISKSTLLRQGLDVDAMSRTAKEAQREEREERQAALVSVTEQEEEEESEEEESEEEEEEIVEAPPKKKKNKKKKQPQKKRKAPLPVPRPIDSEEEESIDTGSQQEESMQLLKGGWLDRFTHIKAPLIKLFRKLYARIRMARGIMFYNDQIDKVVPVINALIEYRDNKDNSHVNFEDLPAHGLKMMSAMMKSVKEENTSRLSQAFVFYISYYMFLQTKVEQDLPWYVEPPRIVKKKKKKKKKEDNLEDLLGGDGFNFGDEDNSSSSSSQEEDQDTSKYKIPSVYDASPLYSEKTNWLELKQNTDSRNRVLRTSDGRCVAVRLCAVAHAVAQDGREGTMKGASKFLGLDTLSTGEELLKSKIYGDAHCFWLWMAFMHELFIGSIPDTRKSDFKKLPKIGDSNLPVMQ